MDIPSGRTTKSKTFPLSPWLVWLGWSIIPGTYLGWEFNPWSGHIWEATSCDVSLHIDVSLSLFLPLCLKSINIFKKRYFPFQDILHTVYPKECYSSHFYQECVRVSVSLILTKCRSHPTPTAEEGSYRSILKLFGSTNLASKTVYFHWIHLLLITPFSFSWLARLEH